MREPNAARARSRGSARIGLFGKFGSGNIGNDASVEVMLNYLRTRHPEALIDAMCTGPEAVQTRYGIDATYLQWSPRRQNAVSPVTEAGRKLLGMVIDAARIAAWTASPRCGHHFRHRRSRGQSAP